MGTNYYYHRNICEHCHRSDVLHVGKKSGGWTFHFHGYRGQADGSLDIISVADWARVFKTTAGILVDEGERVVVDPLQFLAELERPSKEQQEKEDSPEWRGSWSPHPEPDREWRDPEGFAFYDGEFS